MSAVSVILPTFNEAGNIPLLLASLHRQVRNLKEILIVDDNSPDNTAVIAKKWAADHAKHVSVRVILRRSDNGLTQSISEGIRQAKGTIIVWMDADFSHPPEVINTLVAQIENGFDIAVASRFIRGGKSKLARDETESKAAIVLSSLANRIMQYVFQVSFHDFTSGFIAVRKQCVRAIPLTGSYGEYFIDFIIRALAKGYTVVELPYVSPSRLHGASKTAPSFGILLRRVRQYGGTIIRLLWEKYITHTL